MYILDHRLILVSWSMLQTTDQVRSMAQGAADAVKHTLGMDNNNPSSRHWVKRRIAGGFQMISVCCFALGACRAYSLPIVSPVIGDGILLLALSVAGFLWFLWLSSIVLLSSELDVSRWFFGYIPLRNWWNKDILLYVSNVYSSRQTSFS